MTLYEMTNAANELYGLLCSNDIDEQTLNDTLGAMGAEEKLESYCKIIRQLEADAEALKAEKTKIDEKKKAVENSIARMKMLIAAFLKAKGSAKEKSGIFTVTLSKSTAVDIVDPQKIPEEYIKTKVDYDKSAILKVLRAGDTVEGCELKTNEGVQIK